MATDNSISISANRVATPEDILTVHDVQVSRLDADMFTADDLDGATEGLSGSGNLNYLVLQSQQTNEVVRTHDPFDIQASDYTGDNPAILGGFGLMAGSAGAMNGGFAAPRSAYDGASDDSRLAASRLTSADPSSGIGDNGGGGGASALSLFGTGNIQTSALNDSAIYNRYYDGNDGGNGLNGVDGFGNNGNNGGDGNNGTPGPAGPAGASGANGSNGTNGTNGLDGLDGIIPGTPPDDGGDSDLQVDLISDIVGVDLDVILDPVEALIGDIDVDLDVILGDLLSTDDGLLPNPAVILDALVGGIELVDDLQLDVILTPVENLLTDVVEAINPALGGLLPFLPDPLNLVGGLLDQLNGDGDTDLLINGDLGLPDLLGLGALGAIDLNIPLDPVEMILGDIDLDLSVETIVEDLLSGDFSLPVVDIGLLSGGEFLPGLDALLSTDDLPNGIANLAETIQTVLTDDLLSGDLPGDGIADGLGDLLGLLGGGDGDGGSGSDTDLTLATGIGIGDQLLDNLDLDATLDPVENLLGDIDVGLNLETDVVNEVLSGDLHGAVHEAIDTVTNLVDLDLDPFNPEDGQNGGIDLGLGNLLAGGQDDGGGSLDSDLSVDTGLAIGDAVIDQLDANATLDLVENIVGDIDIDVNVQTDFINDVLAGDIESGLSSLIDTVNNAIDIDIALLNPEDNQNGGLDLGFGDELGLGGILPDLGAWPESTIGDVIGSVADPLSGLLGGAGNGGSTLPDPTGLLSEGLGLIQDTVSGGNGNSGGLLGGLGGLFG